MTSPIKLRLLLAIAAARRYDAPAANREALDTSFQEILSKISDDDDAWVVVIGTLLKDLTTEGVLRADLNDACLASMCTAIEKMINDHCAGAGKTQRSLPWLQHRYIDLPPRDEGLATEEEEEEAARAVHCARPPGREQDRQRRGLRDLDASAPPKPKKEKKDDTGDGALWLQAGGASVSAGGGRALLYDRKSSAPRGGGARFDARSDGVFQLQTQRSERRVLVEDGDEEEADESAAGAGGKRKAPTGKATKGKGDGKGSKKMRGAGAAEEDEGRGGLGDDDASEPKVLPPDEGEEGGGGGGDPVEKNWDGAVSHVAYGQHGGTDGGGGGFGSAKKTIDEWKRMLKTVAGLMEIVDTSPQVSFFLKKKRKCHIDRSLLLIIEASFAV
jgi:hypothetical protein